MDFDSTELARLQASDVRGLDACYRHFGARVYRLALSLLGNATDAEDATQEIFIRVFERASSFAGESRFSTWLHRLTVNHCLHALERKKVRRTSALPAPDDERCADASPCPAQLAEQGDERAALWRLLARLGPDQRAILVLREVEGLSYREIADVLSVPAGTVMSRLARARERLLGLSTASTVSELDS